MPPRDHDASRSSRESPRRGPSRLSRKASAGPSRLRRLSHPMTKLRDSPLTRATRARPRPEEGTFLLEDHRSRLPDYLCVPRPEWEDLVDNDPRRRPEPPVHIVESRDSVPSRHNGTVRNYKFPTETPMSREEALRAPPPSIYQPGMRDRAQTIFVPVDMPDGRVNNPFAPPPQMTPITIPPPPRMDGGRLDIPPMRRRPGDDGMPPESTHLRLCLFREQSYRYKETWISLPPPDAKGHRLDRKLFKDMNQAYRNRLQGRIRRYVSMKSVKKINFLNVGSWAHDSLRQ